MDSRSSRTPSIAGNSSPTIERASISERGSLAGDPSLLRNRNKRRDDAIRKKVEQELAKKSTSRRQRQSTPKKPKANTVSSLKPAPAITVLETARIVQAAQLMAAKRADAVLAINEEGQLSGILTDKDIAYRVVAEGLDIRATTVASVMTRNPISVYDKGNRNEALNIMVERKFRHLPVITDVSEEYDDEDEGVERSVTSNVVGLLDITKCVFERLDDLERKVNEDQSIITAMEVLERRGTVGSEHVGKMRDEHSCPDLATVIQKVNMENDSEDVAEVGIRATVREAARVMKEFHSTAVLVLNHGDSDDKLGGIFTTKDIVLRVVAAGLDPNTTSVVRVMTPHPDTVSVEMSILDALKKLHVGHYLHLPVVDGIVPVGLVDVLELTIAMLNYLVSKETIPEQQTPTEGPMWNRFWNSTFQSGSVHDDQSDRQSMVSDSYHAASVSGSIMSAGHFASNRMEPPRPHFAQAAEVPSLRYGQINSNPMMPMNDEMAMYAPGKINPNQMMPMNDEMSMYGQSQYGMPPPAQEDDLFAFKLRDGKTGKVYRFASSSSSFADLVEQIFQKCGVRVNPTSENRMFRVSYTDDEHDLIHLASDKDLEEACAMAKRAGWTRLMLYLGDPPLNPISPSPPPPASSYSETVKETERSLEVATIPKVQEKVPSNQVVEFLKEAPLAVNVAITASIVVIAVVVINRITNY